MRGLGTDHVILGPMRGLDKNCIRWRKQTDRRIWRLYDWIGPVGMIQWKVWKRSKINENNPKLWQILKNVFKKIPQVVKKCLKKFIFKFLISDDWTAVFKYIFLIVNNLVNFQETQQVGNYPRCCKSFNF